MDDRVKILSIYNEVKKMYFPDWDTAGHGRVEITDPLSDWYLGNAYTNRYSTSIEIYKLFTTNDDNVWRCLFVHQIAHAITGNNHGPKWTTKLLEVASQADLSGHKSLADMIRGDVQAFQNCEEPNLNPILNKIRSIILKHPNEPDDVIIGEAVRSMGISSSELLERVPFVKVHCDHWKRRALWEIEVDRYLEEVPRFPKGITKAD
jgi:hypothetical protein